jgi:hypothetical protein
VQFSTETDVCNNVYKPAVTKIWRRRDILRLYLTFISVEICFNTSLIYTKRETTTAAITTTTTTTTNNNNNNILTYLELQEIQL